MRKIVKNKKGLSGVVAMVLLVAMVLSLTAVVWTVVNNLVKDNLGQAEACFGNFGKVTINSRYTCFNSSSQEFQFSISIGDIDVDEVLVSLSYDEKTAVFKIPKIESTVQFLKNYSGGSLVKLPGKNGGSTYMYDMSIVASSGASDEISIAPIIGGKQCGVSDTLRSIDECTLF